MKQEIFIPPPLQNPMRDLLKRLDAQDEAMLEIVRSVRDVVALVNHLQQEVKDLKNHAAK